MHSSDHGCLLKFTSCYATYSSANFALPDGQVKYHSQSVLSKCASGVFVLTISMPEMLSGYVQVSIQASPDLDKQLKAAVQVRGDGTGVT